MEQKYTEKQVLKAMTTELLERFPEFAESEDRKEIYESDGAYTYYSYFGDFLLDQIEKTPDSELVRRSFDFINEVYERENLTSDVWDLLGIQLLERFEMKKEYLEIAEKCLQGKALQALKEKTGRPD